MDDRLLTQDELDHYRKTAKLGITHELLAHIEAIQEENARLCELLEPVIDRCVDEINRYARFDMTTNDLRNMGTRTIYIPIDIIVKLAAIRDVHLPEAKQDERS